MLLKCLHRKKSERIRKGNSFHVWVSYCYSTSAIKCKVKWKNKPCGDVMETDSMNDDQEDEMGWNEM